MRTAALAMCLLFSVTVGVDGCLEETVDVLAAALGDTPLIVFKAKNAIDAKVCDDTWSFLESLRMSKPSVFVFSVRGHCVSSILRQVSATNTCKILSMN
jgi:hypothetical protein